MKSHCIRDQYCFNFIQTKDLFKVDKIFEKIKIREIRIV